MEGGEQAALLTLKMKKSSMNMAPKGRIPAMRMLRQNRRVSTVRRLGHRKPEAPSPASLTEKADVVRWF